MGADLWQNGGDCIIAPTLRGGGNAGKPLIIAISPAVANPVRKKSVQIRRQNAANLALPLNRVRP